MKSKKGADFVVTLLVVLGLAILVFVILAYVFGINVLDIVKRVMPNKANVDDIARTCSIACTTQADYEFCCVERSVVFKEGEKAVKMTCNGDARLKGDCGISCSESACPRKTDEFKDYCKLLCVNDNGANEKAFCCKESRERKSCFETFSAGGKMDITKVGFLKEDTSKDATSCAAVDCKINNVKIDCAA